MNLLNLANNKTRTHLKDAKKSAHRLIERRVGFYRPPQLHCRQICPAGCCLISSLQLFIQYQRVVALPTATVGTGRSPDDCRPTPWSPSREGGSSLLMKHHSRSARTDGVQCAWTFPSLQSFLAHGPSRSFAAPTAAAAQLSPLQWPPPLAPASVAALLLGVCIPAESLATVEKMALASLPLSSAAVPPAATSTPAATGSRMRGRHSGHVKRCACGHECVGFQNPAESPRPSP